MFEGTIEAAKTIAIYVGFAYVIGMSGLSAIVVIKLMHQRFRDGRTSS